MYLILARRQHGKSTLLLEDVPGLVKARSYDKWERGIWPFERRPTLHIRDPKQELQAKIKLPLGWRMESHDTAFSAALASMKGDPRDVVIIEELLTVPKREFAMLDRAVSMSRRSTSSEGPVIIATTQRPHVLPITFRALADTWFCGRITEPDDLKALAKVAGPEKIEQLPALQVGQWMEIEL